MKHLVRISAVALLVSAAMSPAIADDRTPIAPPKTMGDEGKLPATGAV